ncbi:MAG: formate dehydrogenase accessory sulfurtransferase FdhD [Bacillota bacterium]
MYRLKACRRSWKPRSTAPSRPAREVWSEGSVGVHAAAFPNGTKLLMLFMEDVSRHNAVDKFAEGRRDEALYQNPLRGEGAYGYCGTQRGGSGEPEGCCAPPGDF